MLLKSVHNLKFNLFILLALFLFSVFFWLTFPVRAQESDAISIRVHANREHKSALIWYQEEFADREEQGAPQSLRVDGYNAVRDGRTVYVHASNIVDGVYGSYIYLISYSQEADPGTIDVFSRMLKTWTFNTNLIEDSTDFGYCNITDLSCNIDADCGDGYVCNLSRCAPKDSNFSACWRDHDCDDHWYCSSEKAQVTRRTIRYENLTKIMSMIEEHYETVESYPELKAGTYVSGKSLSVWPSWNDNLSQEIGGGEFPLDPINTLGSCPNFDPVTCWNEQTKDFAGSFNSQGILSSPGSSFVYGYTPERVYSVSLEGTMVCEFSTGICN
ncbi:hypothetical protein C0583_05250 [Candidatus Parcubacteria bacterium]|nr:MAG: hypothetical protein C0583_05250 [Candidatus Parcubacteria bacterium]